MKEYIGKVIKINVDISDIDNTFNFIVKVKDNIISINLPGSINVSNIYVNDDVVVYEDIVMGKKVYDIRLRGEMYG